MVVVEVNNFAIKRIRLSHQKNRKKRKENQTVDRQIRAGRPIWSFSSHYSVLN